MPQVTINDAQGLVQSAGSGVTISSNVTVTGDATFSGTVSGLPDGTVVTELDDSGPTGGNETYDLANNTRTFRYTSAPGSDFTITTLTSVDLNNSEATTIRVLNATADKTITLTGLVVSDSSGLGSAATVFPTTFKTKNCSGFTLDIIKNSSGNYFVYGGAIPKTGV